MAGIQSGAAPEDVGNYFTSQAKALNDQWQSAHEQAIQEAQDQTTGLGQGQSAPSAGQAISNELTPQYQDIQSAAKAQVGALGGEEPTNVYGGSMRLRPGRQPTRPRTASAPSMRPSQRTLRLRSRL
jgi:hypothetical protein